MSNALQTLRFEDTEVTALDCNTDEPVFVASPIAKKLAYESAKDMLRNLDSDEKGHLLNLLMGLLIQLEEDYKLNCLDINQVQIYDTTYYSFIFESMITADTNPYKGQLADAAVQFMNDFTDNDGMFISFNQLDRNNWIFQLNFSIS